MEARTWTIVQFITDGTVEVVPTNWLQGDMCSWPPLDKSKLRRAIKKTEKPKTSWKQFAVKIFKNSCFDDYAKATSKAKAAEETSDLQSEIEATGVVKRRKIVPSSWALSSDGEWSSDETILPSPPIQPIKTKIATNQEMSDQDCASQSLLMNVRRDRKREEESTGESSLKTIIQQNHLLRTLLTEVLAEVQDTKQQVQQLKQELQQLKNTVPAAAAPKTTSFFTAFPELLFPVKTEDEMQLLEMKLADKEIFDAAVEDIHKIGGNNSYNFCRRALSCLVTDELALSYSWFGRREKKAFKDYRTASLVIHAAEKAKIVGDRKLFETSVQMWLRRATDRLKTKATKKF